MVCGGRRGKQEAHYGGHSCRRYHTTFARNDEEIRDEIRDRLIRDERVDARQVEVTVEGGVAVLRGEVATLAEKRVAGEDALRRRRQQSAARTPGGTARPLKTARRA